MINDQTRQPVMINLCPVQEINDEHDDYAVVLQAVRESDLDYEIVETSTKTFERRVAPMN